MCVFRVMHPRCTCMCACVHVLGEREKKDPPSAMSPTPDDSTLVDGCSSVGGAAAV